MTLPGDYHVHTIFSDGSGTVAECVEQALAVGLSEIGIADHFSPVQPTSWEFARASSSSGSMSMRAKSARWRAATTASRSCWASRLTTSPEHEAQLRAFLADWSFDYVIGGVHVVGRASSSTTRHAETIRIWSGLRGALHAVLRDGTDAPRTATASTSSRTSDYIGLWGHQRRVRRSRGAIDVALDAIASSGCALELNTDRVSDPAGVMYPSDELLVAAHERSGSGLSVIELRRSRRRATVRQVRASASSRAGCAGYRRRCACRRGASCLCRQPPRKRRAPLQYPRAARSAVRIQERQPAVARVLRRCTRRRPSWPSGSRGRLLAPLPAIPSVSSSWPLRDGTAPGSAPVQHSRGVRKRTTSASSAGRRAGCRLARRTGRATRTR